MIQLWAKHTVANGRLGIKGRMGRSIILTFGLCLPPLARDIWVGL